MFVEHFRDGKIFGEEFDILAVDEGQHLLGPKIQHVLLEHWQGSILAFSGTTAYNEEKNLRRLLPYHIKHADVLSSIEDGMTNGAQLFTVSVGGEEYARALEGTDYYELGVQELRDNAVIDFATPLLAEGCRGMIFCRRGDRTKHAFAMAARLNGMAMPDGREIVAEALSSFNPESGPGSNEDIIKRYHDGEIDVLTSTDTGLEALNADIDFVLFACDIVSLVKLCQAIGRGSRLSERFPITVYAEFIIPYLRRNVRSIYEAFLQNQVEQGKLLIPKETGSNADTNADTEGDNSGTNRSVSGESSKASATTEWRALSPESLPPYLQDALNFADHKTIGVLLLRPNMSQEPTVIPDGFKLLDDIIGGRNIIRSVARSRIERAGYKFVDEYEGGTIKRYYEPNAATFLDKKPIPPKADDTDLTAFALSQRLYIDEDAFKRYAASYKVEPTPKIGKRREAMHFSASQALRMEAILEEEMPWGEPGDRSSGQLDGEYSVAKRFFYSLARTYGIQSQNRRYKEPDENTPRGASFNAKDTQRLRDIFTAHPRAIKTDRHQDDTSDMAGLNRNGSKTLFTPEIKDMTTKKWVTTTDRRGVTKMILRDVWRESDAKAIAKALRAAKTERTLPIHLMPGRALAPLFTMRAPTIVSRLIELAGGEVEQPTLGFTNPGRPACATWETVIKLTKRYSYELKPNAPTLHANYLPRGADEADSVRLAYGRYIQAKFVDANYLGFDPATEIELFERAYPHLRLE